MAKRKIIRIDEDKCDGCGLCITNCPEGALQVIDGKARLISDLFCDGLGACLGHCPKGAITTEEREALPYDEKKVMGNSELRQWPVQLSLVNPHAPYFKDADLLVAADCTAFASGDFHRNFIRGRAAVIFCPKLDEGIDMYREKLAAIISDNNIRSITIARMEVPCCGGTRALVEQALTSSGKKIPVKECVVSLQGAIAREGVLE